MGKKTLRGLLSVPGSEELKVIAGAGGLDREIKWISTVEDIDLVAFSGEGYLNFITGHKMTDERKIFDMVASSCFHNLAGIVFAPGNEPGAYMESVPQNVIDFANEHDFPLFTIHWSTRLSDLTRTIGSFILLDDVQLRNTTEILRDMLSGRIRLPLRRAEADSLAKNLYYENSEYTVLFLSIAGNMVEINEEVKDSLLHRVVSSYGQYGAIIPLETGIAIVFRDDYAKQYITYEKLLMTADELKGFAGDRFHVRFGAGDSIKGYEGIVESYRQAVLVSKLDDNGFYSGKRIFFFRDAGVYRNMWESSGSSNLKRFSEDTLGELMKYDEFNGTDLYNCLETYIKCGCNAKLTSELLYIHKNTVSYKLKKIESILGGELADRRLMFDLQLAIIIKYAFCD